MINEIMRGEKIFFTFYYSNEIIRNEISFNFMTQKSKNVGMWDLNVMTISILSWSLFENGIF